MNEDFAVLLFFFGISITLNLGLSIAWFRANRRTRALERREQQSFTAPSTSSRTDQIENAVDALAAQVDQLASGQEFLNRVLADRLDKLGKALPDRVREVTPH